MYDELFAGVIISGFCEDSPDIGAMHEFCEGKASEIFEGAGPFVVLVVERSCA